MATALQYVDTSALLKAYVSEADSDAFVAWAEDEPDCCISPLSAVELHCAIERRQRMGLIDARQRTAAIKSFDREVADDVYRMLAWPSAVFDDSRDTLARCRPIALRSLDALHLAVAMHYRCKGFATADRAQAQAARRLGFKVTIFLSQ